MDDMEGFILNEFSKRDARTSFAGDAAQSYIRIKNLLTVTVTSTNFFRKLAKDHLGPHSHQRRISFLAYRSSNDIN
tara:strand:+ start:639 stop:866 length:228 start_codon:yes stop_codon:yes gene_type:complete